MNGGTVIPLPARSVREAVCEAMGAAVPEGFRPQATTPATVAAGTDEPERVAVQGVAADAAAFDTDAATSYRDGVKHERSGDFIPASPDWTGSPEQVAEWDRRVADGTAVRWLTPDEVAEFERRGRLSRWQEQR